MRFLPLLFICAMPVCAQVTTYPGGSSSAGTSPGSNTSAPSITSLATETSSTVVSETHKKYTIAYTAINAASTTQDVALATIPVGAVIDKIVIVETASFTGPSGITSMTVSVGRGITSPSDFMLPRPLMQTVNTVNTSAGVLVSPGQFGNSYTLYAEFVNTTASTPSNFGNGTVTNLTAGTVTVDVWFTD